MERIGLKAFEVGSAHLRRVGVTGIVAPELSRLTRALGVTSHYAILDHTDAVYLCKQDPPGLGIRLASSVGARLPSHLTAVGKACLAWLAEERAWQATGCGSAAVPPGRRISVAGPQATHHGHPWRSPRSAAR
ncbi:IclR family transcriptional regulator C-terminal domain-containing protein [Streptomyces sp. NPDC052043]|uniref:IclR family transcriptional regulator domain-containing protein n=1 Tax=Streptomyces sp. NPDC052043 TaxID=3365684 RepID=UPI0037D7222E